MKVFCLDSCLRRNDVSGLTFSSESLSLDVYPSPLSQRTKKYLYWYCPTYGSTLKTAELQGKRGVTRRNLGNIERLGN